MMIKEDKAIIKCLIKPAEEQLNKLQDFLSDKYKRNISLEWVYDEDVKDGFVIEVGPDLYDWTSQAKARQLKSNLDSLSLESENYISLMKDSISSWMPKAIAQEVGIVEQIGDGIAKVSGVPNVKYGEIIKFMDGTNGMVLDVNKDYVGVIIFGDDSNISEGERVVRTGKTAGVGVSDQMLGRVVDSLGNPIDDKGPIKIKDYYPIEKAAPSIIERQPVYRSMETGILAIDSMFPIGRGQRELIIGDRQTGKTAIAMDTIVNQKGKDVICVYVAIGQKASSVAHIVEDLRRTGALEYTVIVCSTASESSSLQYISPYSGCAIAEYFMKQGKDVLIVYDDLSKHATAYRSISLLLERSPGREAYPGDVFYLHSRLLERSAQLSNELGGGSMTALPIVETQAGDVSAYIPTNIISITDGQIFLETDLFFAGQRPAVNVGLSVSRVGGAAQSKAMKKASSTIRLDLAQYREMEIFTQFASDLDQSTKDLLLYGQGLMELLKQSQYSARKLHQQVILLIAALNKAFIGLDPSMVRQVSDQLLDYFAEKYPQVVNHLDAAGDYDDSTRDLIISESKKFIEARK